MVVKIMTMLMSSRVAADTSGEEVLAVLSKLDRDGNGVITVTEFKETVKNDPRLLECFGRLFGVNEAADDRPSPEAAFEDPRRRNKLGVLDLIRGHKQAEVARREALANTGSFRKGQTDQRASKVRHKITMGLAMKKFRKMSLPTMAVTVAALQGELQDTTSRIKFLGKSPAAMAARNYGTKLAEDLKVRDVVVLAWWRRRVHSLVSVFAGKPHQAQARVADARWNHHSWTSVPRQQARGGPPPPGFSHKHPRTLESASAPGC